MKIQEINWVLVFVGLTLIAYALRGKKEGFIRTVFGMFSFILALSVAAVAGPAVNKAVKSNEKVMPYVTAQVETKDLNLPQVLKKSLESDDKAEYYKELAAGAAEDYIKLKVANWVINALCFILIFALTFAVLSYACHALNIISKLPILNGLNKTAGILAGVLRGFITIWMWCIVLTIFAATQIGQVVFEQINHSEFLSLVYNNNLLLEIGKILL